MLGFESLDELLEGKVGNSAGCAISSIRRNDEKGDEVVDQKFKCIISHGKSCAYNCHQFHIIESCERGICDHDLICRAVPHGADKQVRT